MIGTHRTKCFFGLNDLLCVYMFNELRLDFNLLKFQLLFLSFLWSALFSFLWSIIYYKKHVCSSDLFRPTRANWKTTAFKFDAFWECLSATKRWSFWFFFVICTLSVEHFGIVVIFNEICFQLPHQIQLPRL